MSTSEARQNICQQFGQSHVPICLWHKVRDHLKLLRKLSTDGRFVVRVVSFSRVRRNEKCLLGFKNSN